MDKQIEVLIKKDDTVPFHNKACYCIGTGRMNLALRYEYHKQLEKVQNEIGFSYIRGHGLFCDDMAIYQTYEEDGVEKVEYNFTYVDMVFDDYLSLGLKPFVELGFMPEKLASGSQTIFYWKGNVTPPSDYGKWAELIKATINHWISRYGLEEVRTWLFEVWNEPNLPGFWKGADMQEYFRLYEVSSKAVKECDTQLRVGGPAICGVDDERWLRLFLAFCSEHKTPLDFVTRHAYATEMPVREGHYDYQKLRSREVFLSEIRTSRDIIDSFSEYAGMEMHITEFNTSYTPLNPIHDTNLNAAYVAGLLNEMGDVCASYSYWTFGDVFEEAGVAYTPFSGSFGLLANGMIPKPTYYTFLFFQKLQGQAVARGKQYVVTRDGEGNLRGICWNPVEESHREELTLSLRFEMENGEYLLVTKLVDENTCNPLKDWINLGNPANPSKEQLELLRECSRPYITTKAIRVQEQTAEIQIILSDNGICYFELKKITRNTDRGFREELIKGALVQRKAIRFSADFKKKTINIHRTSACVYGFFYHILWKMNSMWILAVRHNTNFVCYHRTKNCLLSSNKKLFAFSTQYQQHVFSGSQYRKVKEPYS